ncbi:mucin-5AC-like [Oryza brachyantha]|nr:mucin-5AC-like [Oryza brachyantha]
MEDLLDTEIGKHDYDWLLTPPGSPHAPILEVVEKAPSSIVSKCITTRSSSTTRASRLSAPETENGHSTVPTRPARSNSVSRPSIQSTLISSNNRSSVLNANNSSVCSRPTTPSKRTSTLSSSKPSIPASRQIPTRSSTPTKTRPSTPVITRPSTPNKTRPSTPVKRPSVPNSMSTSTIAKTTSAQSSRPSTPTSRPRIMNSSSSTPPAASRPSSSSGRTNTISRTSSSTSTIPSASRPSSRSSTPTRQPIVHSSAGPSPSIGRIFGSKNITSIGRPVTSNGRNSAPSSAPSSRPSSPNPRARAPVRPLDIPDFPSETPPNLRTKLPQRPLSVGRARPGVGLGPKSTPNAEQVHSAPVKKMAVPAITRSKFSDPPSRVSSLPNGHQSKQSEGFAVEGQAAKPLRSITDIDNGFGRTLSRKSLDMAIKHMDIRQNLGGIRGASLFPPSIRSAGAKGRPARMSDRPHLGLNGDRHFTDNGSMNGHFSVDSYGSLSNDGGSSTGSPDRESIGTKETLRELDLYTTARYEAMLLREDTTNTNWLHNADDKSDQSPVFDHRFEPLPEPFGPL